MEDKRNLILVNKLKLWLFKNWWFSFLTVLSLSLVIFIGYSENYYYEDGLANLAPYFSGFAHLLLIVCILLFFFVIAIIQTILLIAEKIKGREFIWKRLVLAISPFLISLLLVPTIFMYNPAVPHFLRGFEKWVEKEVDIPEIRKWLVSLGPEYSGEYYHDANKLSGILPEAITSFDPYHICLSKFEDGKRSVEFEWGSAMGHWGVRIGLDGMETPKGEEFIKISEREWEYRRPIQSGVYVFFCD